MAFASGSATLTQGSSEKTAFEIILHQSPTTILSKLLPFGCPVIAKIEGARTKLDPKGAILISIGYSLTSQSHKLLNPVTGRILYSVNVLADLSSFYNPSKSLTSIEELPLPAGESDESSINFNFDEVQHPPDPPATPKANLIPRCDLLEDFSDDDVFKSATSTPVHQAMNAAPSSLLKALNSPEADKWRAAIVKECASMVSNEVWIEVEDTGQIRIPSFVIFRLKGDGTAKARIVAG